MREENSGRTTEGMEDTTRTLRNISRPELCRFIADLSRLVQATESAGFALVTGREKASTQASHIWLGA